MAEHTRYVVYIYIYILSDFSSLDRPQTFLLIFFLQCTKTHKKEQAMVSSGKNLSAAMLLIFLVTAGMYMHMYELLEI